MTFELQYTDSKTNARAGLITTSLCPLEPWGLLKGYRCLI